MSSETSTEAPGAGDLRVSASSSEPLQPWQLFTLAGLIGATIVVFMSRGQSPAGVIVLSCTVFAAAVVAVAALRTLLPLTRAVITDGPQMLGGRTRAALEREKALVLRSIKELEFDRAMGKVSEKDFSEMSGRLRARATRLMRQLDAGSVYRQEIEREVERRLEKAGAARRHRPDTGAVKPQPDDEGLNGRHVADVASVSSRPADGGSIADVPATPSAAAGALSYAEDATSGDPPTGRVADEEGRDESHSEPAACPSCATRNDPDARFCKGCGTRLEAAR
jgi:hypothetical protein